MYDWDGVQLKPAIRYHLAVNHVVRVQVNYPHGLGEAVYVQITGVEGDDLVGVVQDTNRLFFDGEIIYVPNGKVMRFPRACVVEVPLAWNPDLQALAEKTGFGRNLTGMMLNP